MRKPIALLIFALLCLPLPAMADEKPAFLSKHIKAVEPLGKATLRKLLIKVYDGELWADGEWSYDKPFALSLHYDVNIDGEDLVERTFEEIERSSGEPASAWQHLSPQLSRCMPSVKAGDRITALYLPGKGAHFYFNDTASGTINDVEFAKLFFDIWLSPQTTEPAFRQAIFSKQRGKQS